MQDDFRVPVLPREQRENELRELWATPAGRRVVQQLVYHIFPDGVPLPDLDGIIHVILNHEYAHRSASGGDARS